MINLEVTSRIHDLKSSIYGYDDIEVVTADLGALYGQSNRLKHEFKCMYRMIISIQKGSHLPHMQPSCTALYQVTFCPSVCTLQHRTSKGWLACMKNSSQANWSKLDCIVGCLSDLGAESWCVRHGFTAGYHEALALAIRGRRTCASKPSELFIGVWPSSTYCHGWVKLSLLRRQRQKELWLGF